MSHTKKQSNILQHSFTILKNIFKDVLLLYKNFFHWNISKIIIFLWTIIIGITFFLPFFLVTVFLAFLDPINWNQIIGNLVPGNTLDYSIIGDLLVYPGYIFFEVLFLFLGFFAGIIGFSYGIVLQTHLYISYISGKKLPFFTPFFYSRILILHYIKLFLRIFLFLLLPIFSFIFIFLVLYIIFRTGVLSFEFFSYFSFGIFIVIACLFFYLSFRMSFSYIILLDRENILLQEPVRDIVKKSFSISRGKALLGFLCLAILYTLIYSPFSIIESHISQSLDDAKVYLSYKTGNLPLDTEESQLDYKMLQEDFSGKTDNQIIQNIISLGRLNAFLSVLGFLLMNGVFQMILLSFYFHVLKKTPEKPSLIRKFKKTVFGK